MKGVKKYGMISGKLKPAAVTVCSVAASLAFCGAAFGEVKLLDETYDFGVIYELDGTKTGTARVVNLGPDETYIRELRPSCGCTGADYDKEILAPGDTARISFSYNPVGRPGKFNKTVKVYFGDGDERATIHLEGRVLGSPQTLSANYPVEAGRLRLSEREVELRDLQRGLGRHVFIRMVNQSPDTITPVFENHYKALSIDVTPKVMPPGEIAMLGIYLNSRFEEREDELTDYVIPVRAEGDAESVDIVIRAQITPAKENENE